MSIFHLTGPLETCGSVGDVLSSMLGFNMSCFGAFSAVRQKSRLAVQLIEDIKQFEDLPKAEYSFVNGSFHECACRNHTHRLTHIMRIA